MATSMMPRHYFLLLALLALLALLCAAFATGCHSTRPAPDERVNAGIVPHAVQLDTTAAAPVPDSITVTPRATLLDRLRGRVPVPVRVPAGTVVHTGKKATVNVYNGPATITTIGKKANAATGTGAKVAVAGKTKAPLAMGDNTTAQDFTKQAKNGAAANGDGATATATQNNGFPWWILAVVGAALLGWRVIASGKVF